MVMRIKDNKSLDGLIQLLKRRRPDDCRLYDCDKVVFRRAAGASVHRGLRRQGGKMDFLMSPAYAQG